MKKVNLLATLVVAGLSLAGCSVAVGDKCSGNSADLKNKGLYCNAFGEVEALPKYKQKCANIPFDWVDEGQTLTCYNRIVHTKKDADDMEKKVQEQIKIQIQMQQYYNEGKRLVKNNQIDKAQEYFEKSCNLGYAEACMVRGYSNVKNYEVELKYYKRACELKLANGCFFVYQRLYPKGKKAEAFSYLQKAYEIEPQQYAVLLGGAYQDGRGVKKDLTKARELLEEACENGDGNGCWGLGEMYFNGEGVAKDTAKAEKYFDKACGFEKNLGISIGSFFKKRNDIARAKKYFKIACGNNETMWNWTCKANWNIK